MKLKVAFPSHYDKPVLGLLSSCCRLLITLLPNWSSHSIIIIIFFACYGCFLCLLFKYPNARCLFSSLKKNKPHILLNSEHKKKGSQWLNIVIIRTPSDYSVVLGLCRLCYRSSGDWSHAHQSIAELSKIGLERMSPHSSSVLRYVPET